MSDDEQLVISDLEEPTHLKPKRIDLSINQPTKRTHAQKESLEKAQAARKAAAEKRREKKTADVPPVEEASQATVPEPDQKLDNKHTVKDKGKGATHDESKEMRRRLKQIDLEKLINYRINVALENAEDERMRMKDVKRLRKLEDELAAKKDEESRTMKRCIRMPDGRIFGER
jgi:hypothetical protein